MTEPAARTYERTLAAARAALASAPPPEPGPAALDRALDRGERRARRRLAWIWASLAAAVATWVASMVAHPIVEGLCPQTQVRDVFELGLVPTLSLVLSAVLVTRRSTGAQLLARATWWSGLLLGVAGVWGAPGLVPLGFCALALGAGSALLLAQDHGLEPEHDRGELSPRVHRSALMLALLLAMADAQALLAINQANAWRYPFTAACGLAMLIAVFGLYRLRGWGLLANVAVNLVVAAAALTGHLDGLPELFALGFVATATVQLGLLVPLLRSLLRGEERERSLRGRRAIANVVIVAAMATAAVGGLVPQDPAAVAAYCAQNFELPVASPTR